MKRLYKLLISVMMIASLLPINNVCAAGLDISTSNGSPYVGTTFKVKISASGYAGKFGFSSTPNIQINKSEAWLENSSITLTCTAVGEGTGSVSVSTIDVAAFDSGQTVSLSKSVGVNCRNKEDTTLGDNSLKTLSVEGATLSPKFKAGVTSYKAVVKRGTTSTTINATATQAKASVAGAGKKDLKEGSNKFTIVVTAANGSKKNYTVNVVVPSKPSTFIEVNGKKYGLVTELDDVELPKSFKVVDGELQGNKTKCLVNESKTVTLYCLMDDQDQTDFYLNVNEQFYKYEPVTLDHRSFIVLTMSETPSNTTLTQLTVSDQSISNAYQYNDPSMNNYYVLYLFNIEKGTDSIYVYETTEDTIQLDHSNIKQEETVETKDSNTLVYVFMTISGVLLMCVIGLFVYIQRFKKKSIRVIKEYYEARQNKNKE